MRVLFLDNEIIIENDIDIMKIQMHVKQKYCLIIKYSTSMLHVYILQINN